MQAMKAAKSAYGERRKVVKNHRNTVVGLWFLELFDVPPRDSKISCFCLQQT